MNLKIFILSIATMAISVFVNAQTARNPLNLEPAQVTLQKRISSWKLSEEIFYRADGTPFDKRSYVYDENGRKTEDLTLSWSGTNNTWLQTMQSHYQFETDKKVVINKAGRQFTSKTDIISDATGKPVYSFSYQWNRLADDWSIHPFRRCEWVYDSNGLVSAYLKQHINKETNEWNEFDARILYTYDETGALTEEIYQSWNANVNQWADAGKYKYATVSEQQKIATSYIYASGHWVSDGKTVYLFDEEGKITRCEYFKNDTDKSLNAYSINTYSECVRFPDIVELSSINIYPNPVVSSFELTVPNVFLGMMALLYDVSGKQVMTFPVLSQQTQVDVSRLTSGVYFLKIGNISKTIILQ